MVQTLKCEVNKKKVPEPRDDPRQDMEARSRMHGDGYTKERPAAPSDATRYLRIRAAKAADDRCKACCTNDNL
jgi:hypothetical protein